MSLTNDSIRAAPEEHIIPTIVVNNNEEPEEQMLYTEQDIEDGLEEILAELNDAPQEQIPPVEREAVVQYAESLRQNKYLFDGENLVHIVPQDNVKAKAILGKSIWKTMKIAQSVAKIKKSFVTVFDGYLTDYLPKKGARIPTLIYACINEIESRGDIAQGWVYQQPSSTGFIQKVKRKFMAGEMPKVN